MGCRVNPKPDAQFLHGRCVTCSTDEKIIGKNVDWTVETRQSKEECKTLMSVLLSSISFA